MTLPPIRVGAAYLLTLAFLFVASLVLAARSEGSPGPDSLAPPGPEAAQECPGELMDVQATGIYQNRPVPEAVINGAPWGGAYWEAGMRSYWHCHPGGQLMVVWEGEGRVQKRGERAVTLSRGESHFARPWEEHWHGATPDSDAQYLQVAFEPMGTLWMEEVSETDFLGNDIGVRSREEFLDTGIRENARR